MGWFDWLGPTSMSKRRGWDALPAVVTVPDRKSSPPGLIEGFNAALTVRTLVHGPGASDFLYGGQCGQSANSSVFACLQAIAVAIAEPELKVYQTRTGERIEQDDTELGRLLAHPNAHFSLDTLLAYLTSCLHVEGNAYWRKLRAGDELTGNVVELWPISPTRITPRTEQGSAAFIDSYRYYYSSTQFIDLPPSSVVHFRYGLDDRDHRLGMSPLKRLAREISSDEQATRYAERLLANLAINGLTLSFDKESPSIDQATADELKARIQQAYGGDNVGGAAVLSPGATLTPLGFSPEQMDMKTLHRVPEERISAVLGVPAIVAGLGAGLDRSTYANFKEARESFTEQKMLPLWRQIASEITLQLVPDFVSDGSTIVEFDIADIRALADDQNAAAMRLKTLVDAGIMTKDEARGELGLEPLPEQEEPEPAPVVVPPRLRSGQAGQPEAAAMAARGVRLLPPADVGKADVRGAASRKAIEDIPDRYADLRASSLPTWEAELAAFFVAQQRRVDRRLRAGADIAEDLVTEGEAVLLADTLEPLQLSQLGAVSRVVAAELGIAFDLDDPATRAFLRECGLNITGITDTTRDAVRAALLEGQQAGEGIPELAGRLQALPEFTRSRAETVARTELGISQNQAALTSYRGSGVVVGIRVLDGDYDAACQAMNGRVFTLDQAPPSLQHPRCVRAFAPLVDADQLTRSA